MRYELQPQEDGSWVVRHPNGSEEGGFEDRRAAYEAAREARGDQRMSLFDGDGNFVMEHEMSRGPEAIVLFRADGSFYGELSHAQGNSDGPAQHVSLVPAEANDSAVEGEGA